MHYSGAQTSGIARGASIIAFSRGSTPMRPAPLAFALVAVLLAAPASAQDRGRNSDRERDDDRRSQNVPPGHLPPPGKCRVWFDSRPPGQQPAPTSCGVARAEAARTGGRVIYGGDDRRDDRKRKDDDRRDCDAKDRAKGECGDRDDDKDRNRDKDKDRDRDKDKDKDRDRDKDKDKERDRDEDKDRDRDRDRDDDDDDDDRDGERDRDRDRDREAGEYPTTLPEMVWGVILGRGESVEGARRWVGAESVRVRYTDADRNGVPELVSLYRAGQLIQQWADSNRDGRADRVSFYRNGSVVRVIP